jgi:hypothetical protein
MDDRDRLQHDHTGEDDPASGMEQGPPEDNRATDTAGGALAGGAAGLAIGGPVGAVVGAALGAAAGNRAGASADRAVAEGERREAGRIRAELEPGLPDGEDGTGAGSGPGSESGPGSGSVADQGAGAA